MSDKSRKVWVRVSGEDFLVEIEDLTQRPVIAYVEGFRYEIDPDHYQQVVQDFESNLITNQQVSPIHSVPAGTVCEVTSPMPGDIVEILVQLGQAVQKGDPLCVLDAMKMKNTIHAPQDGTVAEICVQEGQSVEYDTDLFRFE